MPDQQTLDVYQRIRAGEPVGFGQRPALIVIDFNLGMTDRTSPLGDDLDAYVEATVPVLQAARTAGIPRILVTVEYENGLQDAGMLGRKVPAMGIYTKGSHWVELDPRVAWQEGDYLLKKRFQSCFLGSNLSSILTMEQVDTLLVTGCHAGGCVRHTVFDAASLGYHTILVEGTIGARTQHLLDAAMFEMTNTNADLVPQTEVLDYIARSARPQTVPLEVPRRG